MTSRNGRFVLAIAVVLVSPLSARAQVLVVDGSNSPYVVAAPTSVSSVSVGSGGVLIVNAPLSTTGDVTVGPNGRMTLDAGVHTLRLSVGGLLAVELGGAIDLAALGLCDNTSLDPVTAAEVQLPGGWSGSHFALGGGAGPPAGYDEPSNPTRPGASGGSSQSTAESPCGGGALLATAASMRIDGVVRVDGASTDSNAAGGAAGGTLNLAAAQIGGGGVLSAEGGANRGAGTMVSGGAGGLIRLAADAITFTGRFAVSGGTAVFPGSDGTAVLFDRSSGKALVAAGEYPLRSGESHLGIEPGVGGTLRVVGPAKVAAPIEVPAGATLILASEHALDDAVLAPVIHGTIHVDVDLSSATAMTLGGTLVLNRQLALPSFDTLSGAIVTHDPGVRTMHLVVGQRLALVAGARIDGTGLGLRAQRTLDPFTGREGTGSVGANGGSHGGLGGLVSGSTGRAPVFDDPSDPQLPGGGGGAYSSGGGGSGGGVLRVTAGLAQIDGAIVADGTVGDFGGFDGQGAGGTINLHAGALTGSGAIVARGGGTPSGGGGGGGGGGLVLLATAASSFTGVVTAAGGSGAAPGGAGVVTQSTVTLAPIITSSPTARAARGAAFHYLPQVTGTPPFAWTLRAGPSAASCDAATGAFAFTPADLGVVQVELAVSNAFGEDRQAFSLVVEDVDATEEASVIGPPRFVSTPGTSGRCGVPYRYSGAGAPIVAGRGPFTFSVSAALGVPLPGGLVVDATTGAFAWTPSAREVGAQPIELRVVGPEGEARQSFAVIVECPGAEPLKVGCGCGPGETPAVTLALGVAGLLAALRARLRTPHRAR
jgi:MYXO-CTERM domain-containing protein